jgi:hypothetical protein
LGIFSQKAVFWKSSKSFYYAEKVRSTAKLAFADLFVNDETIVVVAARAGSRVALCSLSWIKSYGNCHRSIIVLDNGILVVVAAKAGSRVAFCSLGRIKSCGNCYCSLSQIKSCGNGYRSIILLEDDGILVVVAAKAGSRVVLCSLSRIKSCGSFCTIGLM